MNCTESLDLLNQRLDGIPGTDHVGLAEHLGACPECRALHAVAARLEDGLRLLTPPAPPPGLNAAIIGRVLEDRRARRRMRRTSFAAAAVAAGLLLAVFLGAWAPWQAGSQQAHLSEPIHVAQPPVAEVPSLRDSFTELGSALASLTQRTATQTVEQSRLLLPDTLPAPPLTESPAVQEALEPPTQSLRQAGQGVASALDPVTTSARRAFGMLLREAPATPENQ